jgi:hypothetical protein
LEIIYFVDGVDGSDLNSGTSRDQAWRTIQKAANTMIAGDSVTVLAGNYNERVQVSRSGVSGSPITYAAEGTVVTKGFTVYADYITIRGFEVTDTPDLTVDGVGIFVEGSHCIIEDNYVHYATRGGIRIYADPGKYNLRTDNLVRNNRLYRNAMYGIEIHGRNHIIVSNEISHTIQYHPAWANLPDWVDSDGMKFFGLGHTFRGNYIHDITFDDPENVNPHIDCWQTWQSYYYETASNILFEKNICENLEFQSSEENGFGFKLAGGANNLIIRNNIIQAFGGLRINGTGAPSHLYVYNNLLVSDLSFGQYWSNAIELLNAPSAIVKNNILYDQAGGTVTVEGDTTGQEIDYNLAFNSDGCQPICFLMDHICQPLHAHNLWGIDPLFVNPMFDDFHLLYYSPAIDAGVILDSVNDDFDGLPRPLGTGFDIGVYEHHTFNINVNPPIAYKNDTLSISITFTPTSQALTLYSILPQVLHYSSSTASCPATVTYADESQIVLLSGNPLRGSDCNLQINTIVNTDQKLAVTISATIDYGFTAPQCASRTVVLNGLPLHLPLILEIP